MPDQDIGTLYVLANCDSSLAKVGFTRSGTPDARADAYARDHGIQWHTYWSARTRNVAAAEASAHCDLQDRRFSLVPEAREVFHLTPQHAQRIAARYVDPPETDAQPDLRSAQPAWRSRLERSVATVLLIVAYWPALRRLYRQARAVLRA